MKMFLLISICMLLFSCNRKMKLDKSKLIDKSEHVSSFTDSSETQTLVTEHKAFIYGDTLIGSLPFFLDTPDSIVSVDSMRSSGIKVKIRFTKHGNRVSADVEATAESKQIVNTTTTATNQQKYINAKDSAKNNVQMEEVNKNVESQSIMFKVLGTIFIIGISIVGIIYFFHLFKRGQ